MRHWRAVWMLTTALFATAASAEAAGGEVWLTLPTPLALPQPKSSGYVQHEGARIYYETYGSGAPVILLHGGLANARYWGDQVPALTQAGFRSILIESRGHGRSTRDARPYTYELMASDVVAVMNHLHLQKTAVVGWSDGAIIGLVMALKDPDRITRVFAFAANMDPSGVKSDTTTNPTFSRFEAQAAKQYATMSPTPGGFEAFSKAINHMWDVEPNYKLSDLALIHTPTDIVDGDHDEAIKRDHTEYLAKNIPGAQLTILPESSHFAMLQQPKEFNTAMLDFLRAGRS